MGNEIIADDNTLYMSTVLPGKAKTWNNRRRANFDNQHTFPRQLKRIKTKLQRDVVMRTFTWPGDLVVFLSAAV